MTAHVLRTDAEASALGDAELLLAFPRYPADLMKLLRYTAGRGVPILAITDSPLSPVILLAQVTLFARASMLDFVGSLAAPAALINLVVSDLGLRMGRPAINRLQELEDVAVETGIYVKSESHTNGNEPGSLAWRVTNGRPRNGRAPGRARRHGT